MYTKPRTWADPLDKRPRLKKMEMKFGTWNVRSLYRAGSLRAVAEELLKYKSGLAGVQEVRWDGGGTDPPGEYTFFYGQRNENDELGTGYFVHKRIVSAVKRVEFVSDRISYIILKGRWCDSIVMNVHAPTEDKIDDIKERFYEELESITPNKMADNDMSFRQRAIIEFLVKEEIPAAEIHQRLQRAYGSVCMGANCVRRWVKHFKDGNTSIENEPRSGRPRRASTESNKKRVDEIIQDDRRVTLNTIARKLGIGHSAVEEMIESLGYRKVCARWVPLLLTEDHKGQRKAITPELLQRYR
ncbi:hypothetical protein B7P43_G01150 [Cryptotermes secundus]|uniref:Mos1 transposase HTH domain-containing protein n=1 Tax=Cryptotermes secundus TaxID=105785 RepID=A0A2J7QZZ0_9NEOP|nr:hypothetical protein B7P43_G01150 [Cryptotermes secundus]